MRSSFKKESAGDFLTHQGLLSLVEVLAPQGEVSVRIVDSLTDEFVDQTYAIGFDFDEEEQLILIVDTEKGKFDRCL